MLSLNSKLHRFVDNKHLFGQKITRNAKIILNDHNFCNSDYSTFVEFDTRLRLGSIDKPLVVFNLLFSLVPYFECICVYPIVMVLQIEMYPCDSPPLIP